MDEAGAGVAMVAPLGQMVVSPILVGRASPMATLERLVERACAGQGAVALLVGEAGVGKSRLVAEVKGRARQRGMACVEGQCFEPDRALPYAPLLDLLRGLIAGLSPAEAEARLGASAGALLALLPEIDHPASSEPARPQDPAQEKHLLIQGFLRLIGNLATEQPMLLVVEDIHWSDEASLEVLLALARRLAALPVLLLLTHRSDEEHPALVHFLADLDRARLATEVRLSPLAAAEVETLVRAIFNQERPVRAEFVATLHGLTEGNPFFIEEVLKALLLAGDIFYADGRWDRKPLEQLRIPRTVGDAVRRRTERLGGDVRETLRLAAVAGRRVDFPLIAALTGHDEPMLVRHFKELLAAQLLVEESADSFAFRHALTRQAIYTGLLTRERRALHRQVAAALERLHAAAPGRVLADLSYHCHAGEEWARALDYGQRAGEQAQARHAPRAAVIHFTRALEAAQALGQDAPPAMYRARGQAHETLGEFERARDDLAAALAAHRAAADRAGEWQALLDLGFLWTARDYAPAGEFFRAALALARDTGDDARQGRSLNRLGNWHLNGGRPAEALRHYEEALAIFEDLGDRQGIAETLDLLGMATAHNGDAVAGAAYYERVIPLLRALDDRRGLVSSLAMRAELSANIPGAADATPPGPIAEASLQAEEAVALAQAIGWRAGEAYALMSLGSCRLALGDYDRALALLAASRAVAEEIGHRGWLVGAQLSIGGTYADLLAFPTARHHLNLALAEGEAIGFAWFVRLATLILAQIALVEGDLARAEMLLDGAFGTPQEITSLQERSCWLLRGELALARGDAAGALDIANRLIAAAKHPATTIIPSLWQLRGRALAATGRADEGIAAIQAAIAAVREKGQRPLLWPIQIALGKVYQVQGRQQEAGRAFQAARTVVETLAASVPDTPDATTGTESLRANYLRLALGMIPAPRPLTPLRAARAAAGGLTAREREVAVLIARGRSNREIAAALVIGERTVQTHIGNIFAKLGCDSRAQVAAWVAERGLMRRGE